jgi:HrpA-like RNA helicase
VKRLQESVSFIGDILVFLPGLSEIRRMKGLLLEGGFKDERII